MNHEKALIKKILIKNKITSMESKSKSKIKVKNDLVIIHSKNEFSNKFLKYFIL